MNTFVEPTEDAGFQPNADGLSADERAWWEASIERDMRNPNRGKAHRPIAELRKKMLDVVEQCYEGVPC